MHTGFAASIAVRVLGAVLALAVNVWLARLLGVVDYGRYMVLLSSSFILGGLAVSGVDQLLTRELASRADRTTQYSCTLIVWGLKRVVVCIAAAISAYTLWSIVAYSSSLVGFLSVVLGVSMLGAFFSISVLLGGGINGLGASLRSQILALVLQNAAMLILISCVLMISGSLSSAQSALWLQVGAYLVALSIGAIWFGSLYVRKIGVCQGAVNGALIGNKKSWFRSSNHYMMMTVAGLLVNRLDVVLISVLTGDADASIYAVGARLAQVSLMVALAVNVVLSPKIAAAWAHEDFDTVKRLVISGFMFTVPVAFFEIVVAVFFGEYIVLLFGPEYARASSPFIWVTVAYALWTLSAPAYALMAMAGSEKTVAILSWLILISNVIAIFILVPYYGATGGSIAMVVGYAFVIPVVVKTVKMKLSYQHVM